MTIEPPLPPLFTGAFPRFWLSRVLSTLSFQMMSVAIGWQIYELTSSTLALGLVGLAQFAPMVCLTLLVGHVADRYDRRTVAALCQGCEMLIAIGLGLTAVTHHGPAPVYVLAALLGAARAFEVPTVQALLPRLVSRSIFPRASAMSSVAAQTAQIAGPALGGLLYAAGPLVVYGTCTIALACAVAAILSVPGGVRLPEASPNRSVFSGLAFIAGDRLMLGVTSLDLFAVLFGGATALLPVFARDILQVGSVGLGILRSAPSVGAIAVSVLISRRHLPAPIGPFLFGALGLFGAATIVFGLSRSLPLSLAALVVLGAADSLSVAVRNSLIQLRTPDAMRGRVTAVGSLFTGTSNQLGEFESGVLASMIGTVPSVVAGGAAVLAIGLVWTWIFPVLPRLRTLADVDDVPQAARA